jgi:hypothetical protein
MGSQTTSPRKDYLMRLLMTGLFCALVAFPTVQLSAQDWPVLAEDNFEDGTGKWHFSDPKDADPTWTIQSIESNGNKQSFLRSMGGSKFEPPHRSPWNIALLKEPIVGDCEITVRVLNTNYDAGDHRDLCIFWGYQDPAHMYYVHLGAKPDPHSCQIFIVNDADRKMITDKKSTGTPWDRDWHEVKVVRNVESGSIEVFFDDMEMPVMTANDKTFTWGRVGIGTFDDNGNFDDFKLRGVKIDPVPKEAKLPGE